MVLVKSVVGPNGFLMRFGTAMGHLVEAKVCSASLMATFLSLQDIDVKSSLCSLVFLRVDLSRGMLDVTF